METFTVIVSYSQSQRLNTYNTLFTDTETIRDPGGRTSGNIQIIFPITESSLITGVTTATIPILSTLTTSIASTTPFLAIPTSLSSPLPSESASSSTTKVGLGLGLGLGIPLLVCVAGLLFFALQRHHRARNTPEPGAGYLVSDAVANSTAEKKRRVPIFVAKAQSLANRGGGSTMTPELQEHHMPPALREAPGTPTSRRGEMP